jgi:hypothetical protein
MIPQSGRYTNEKIESNLSLPLSIDLNHSTLQEAQETRLLRRSRVSDPTKCSIDYPYYPRRCRLIFRLLRNHKNLNCR